MALLGRQNGEPSPQCADRRAEWCRWAVLEQECGESGSSSSSSSSKAGSGASAGMAVTVPAAGKVAAAPAAAGAASPVAAQATAAAAAMVSCTAKVRPRLCMPRLPQWCACTKVCGRAEVGKGSGSRERLRDLGVALRARTGLRLLGDRAQ